MKSPFSIFLPRYDCVSPLVRVIALVSTPVALIILLPVTSLSGWFDDKDVFNGKGGTAVCCVTGIEDSVANRTATFGSH